MNPTSSNPSTVPPSVFIVVSPLCQVSSDAVVAALTRSLELNGLEVVSSTDNLTADVLAFVSDSSVATPTETEMWLESADRVNVSLTVGLGARSPYLGDLDFLYDDSGADDGLDHVAGYLAQVCTSPRDLVLNVTVTRERSESSLEFGDPDSLQSLLADGHRVLSATYDSIEEMVIDRPGSARALQVNGLLRWAKRRRRTPDTSLTFRSGPQAGQDAVAAEASSLFQALESPLSSRLVLLTGRPGAGKSTQMRACEAQIYQSALSTSVPAAAAQVFRVNLAEHAAHVRLDPFEWLSSKWTASVNGTGLGSLEEAISEGSFYLLLDGFNESPHQTPGERQDWGAVWKELAHDVVLEAHPHNTVAIASRSHAAPHIGKEGSIPQTEISMAPLRPVEILGITAQRNARSSPLLERGLRSDALLGLYEAPLPAMTYADIAVTDVPQSTSTLSALFIASAVVREAEAGNDRLKVDEIFPARLLTLFRRDMPALSAVGIIAQVPLFRALGHLYLKTGSLAPSKSNRGHSDRPITYADARDELSRFFVDGASRLHSDTALDLALDLGLLGQDHAGNFNFVHSSYGEFLAATYTSTGELLDRSSVPVGEFQTLHGETAVEAMKSTAYGHKISIVPTTGFEELVRRKLEIDRDSAFSFVSGHPWLVLEHVSSALSELDDRDTNQLLEMVRRELDSRRSSEDLRERIAVHEGLGVVAKQLSTSAPHRPASAPGLDLVTIPRRIWDFSPTDEDRRLTGTRKLQRIVELDTFQIGRSPVTNLQYAQFVSAGGYKEQTFWTDGGWQWRCGRTPVGHTLRIWKERREKLRDRTELLLDKVAEERLTPKEAAGIRRFVLLADAELEDLIRDFYGREVNAPAFWHAGDALHHPNKPVVGVSWYEASAYCSWIAQATGRPVRLPTEDEWEAAAIFSLSDGDASRLADLDIEPELGRWNTAETKIGKLTPVGAMDDGREILSDVQGSVFEWCFNQVGPGELGRYVMKGGSWRRTMERAMISNRGRGDVTLRNDDVGLRISCGVESGLAHQGAVGSV